MGHHSELSWRMKRLRQKKKGLQKKDSLTSVAAHEIEVWMAERLSIFGTVLEKRENWLLLSTLKGIDPCNQNMADILGWLVCWHCYTHTHLYTEKVMSSLRFANHFKYLYLLINTYIKVYLYTSHGDLLERLYKQPEEYVSVMFWNLIMISFLMAFHYCVKQKFWRNNQWWVIELLRNNALWKW